MPDIMNTLVNSAHRGVSIFPIQFLAIFYRMEDCGDKRRSANYDGKDGRCVKLLACVRNELALVM